MLPSAVADRLDRLAPDRREAATAPPSPVLCVTPGGSGNTTALVARIAWLVATGWDPTGITAVTFKKRVAHEMAASRRRDRERPPVQLWLTDSMSSNVLGQFVRPDSITVVTTEAGSAVLALEIDEGTEHRRTIRAKLAAYRRPIAIRPNWHLLVVVPGPIRAAWMVRVAGSLDLGPRSWVVTLGDLERDALDCVLQPLDLRLPPASIRSLLQPPRRLLPAPVGSRAWLELLAAGGGETEDGALAP